ncbi:hypothetical protein MMC28_010459 [Mycoblastus sanguinarius]|nr:hypothetical protein [Mycoblastus sanguinarius]
MFACEAASAHPTPTSTTWLSAISSSTTPTNAGQDASFGTTSSATSSPSSSRDSTANGNDGGNSSSSENGGSGDSQANRIAIDVGLGVGLPTVVVGLLAWLFPKPLKRKNKPSVKPIPLRMHYIPTNGSDTVLLLLLELYGTFWWLSKLHDFNLRATDI